MFVDPFRLSLALGPIAAYLLLLGWINVSRRPFVTTGARDLAALGMAVAGLMAIGPLALFMPEAAVGQFGQPTVWLMLTAFYTLCVSSLVLVSRPRLVIYNITAEQLRPVMARVAAELDSEARWAGESLFLPRLGVQLHIDFLPALRNASLVANGENQNLESWRQLEKALRAALAGVQTTPSPWGVGMIATAGILILVSIASMIAQPVEFALEMREMIRR